MKKFGGVEMHRITPSCPIGIPAQAVLPGNLDDKLRKASLGGRTPLKKST